MTAAQAKKQLQNHADSERAVHAQKYFKTAKGEYGEGDRFIGVRVPEVRKIARQFNDLPIAESEKLLHSKIHEQRLLALIILVNQFKQAGKSGQQKIQQDIYRVYLQQYQHINNWDLVDVSCRDIVGGYLLNRPQRERQLLYDWARSDHLWKKRIAIVATATFIQHQDFHQTLKIAEILIHDQHDLIHKATGWMLREVGNKNRRVMCDFLDRHALHMPRTMLRYAIEKLPQKIRKSYLNKHH